ncbi:MAG: hypothetical protein MUF40_04005 [Gemmatimonadaceae bacterium]|jgi:hypothetical protein|nr:hypothetical protein [Gemmatimonadaceae bacterium]
MRYLRLAITLALALYGVSILRAVEPGAFIDHVNLAIHEAGHVVFAPFGDTFHWLGGTLLQLLVPLAFCVYFIRESDEHGASVALWWVAENCWHIAIYIRDAEAMELPLVGGGEHDWNTLLTAWGLIGSSGRIADLVRLAGMGLFALSIVWGLSSVLRAPSRTVPLAKTVRPVVARRR